MVRSRYANGWNIYSARQLAQSALVVILVADGASIPPAKGDLLRTKFGGAIGRLQLRKRGPIERRSGGLFSIVACARALSPAPGRQAKLRR